MVTYTEKQAKHDSVVLWSAILQALNDGVYKEIADLKVYAISNYIDNPEQPMCGYCKQVLNCEDCIGVKEKVFSFNSSQNIECHKQGSLYYDIDKKLKSICKDGATNDKINDVKLLVVVMLKNMKNSL